MQLGKTLFIFPALILSSSLFAQEVLVHTDPSPLAKGTKIAAAPNHVNEFYIIAENDEPRLKAVLKERATVAAAKQKSAHKAEVLKVKALVNHKQKHSVNRTKLALVPKKAHKHMPSKMELALNNALEKAISKKHKTGKTKMPAIKTALRK